jgi:transcriptional regulator with XRE-family HTH domain
MNIKPNGLRIRVLRTKKAWSQQQLAESAAVSQRTVQRAEEGRAIQSETLLAIAAVFEIDVGEIDASTEGQAMQPRPRLHRGRRLGRYGPLLAAISDTLRAVLHWRRGFADTFMYRSFFMRKQDSPVFAQLEAEAHLAATSAS